MEREAEEADVVSAGAVEEGDEEGACVSFLCNIAASHTKHSILADLPFNFEVDV